MRGGGGGQGGWPLRCTAQVSVPLKGELDEEEEKWRMAKGVGKNESVAAAFLLRSPYG